MTPRFAILILDTLKVVRFGSRDELKVACASLTARHKIFLAFAWNEGASVWHSVEVCS